MGTNQACGEVEAEAPGRSPACRGERRREAMSWSGILKVPRRRNSTSIKGPEAAEPSRVLSAK